MSKSINITIGIAVASMVIGLGIFALKGNDDNLPIKQSIESNSNVNNDEKEVVKLTEKPKIFNSVKNYNIYYGYEFTDEIIESMYKYDVVVLEPLNVHDETILQKLKDKGVKVFGYVTFAEVSPFDKETLSKVKNSDYLKIDGERVQNFGCDIADIRSDHFKEVLMQTVQTKIIDAGYDGIFLDTLDDFEFISILKSQELVDEMTSEVAELLKKLNTEFPYLNVILNRAFTGIEKCEERYVDAVLFESMSPLEGNAYYDNMVSKIDKFTSQGGVCLSLSNSPEQEKIGIKTANDKGWIHFYRPDQEYTKWYEYLN